MAKTDLVQGWNMTRSKKDGSGRAVAYAEECERIASLLGLCKLIQTVDARKLAACRTLDKADEKESGPWTGLKDASKHFNG